MRLSHISWNLAGLTLPLLVAAVTVPQLIQKLGNERFGLLALAWGLIGYAGALDLGIGRALTQLVSSLRGADNLADIPDVLATARRITLVAGLVGGILVAATALLGGYAWIDAHGTPPLEIRSAMILLAIALPAQAMSATYRGMNEAFLNFKGISLLRAGLGVINFGGPYLVTLYTNQLPWLIATLVVSRVLALFAFDYLAARCMRNGGVGYKGAYSSRIARSLFAFGGWVTVSSIVSPILVQADRFVIASVISAAAVTVYVLPYEMVTQSLILVSSVSSVMFPTLSQLMRERPGEWRPYFRRWLFIMVGLMAVVSILMALLLPDVLLWWIKDHLKSESIVIGQVLCLGVFANAIGSMFYALIQADGRASLTATLHMIELPIFVVSLYFLLNTYGIHGAAWAWVGRMIFDASALAYYSRMRNV
ncbi:MULTISPECIES: oligosaccharide flippase family protein [Cupriavidus]|uniref:Polysaccharide biosynthesis protein n=1 Tax=Cupriavidus pinatubonensis (strain JMP 134 / LMG 1197) TaxID=264198 RepID=Q46Q92_CUPPJ|nr:MULTISPECIES: oligosaccharide flippase family protein [Cupriavidus]QYY27687.1 oligosaccharide flippase family protein [Cupriavidus pinatubonensis]TPQ38999.1 flippase [Cupriavidus pinatubonensis]